MTRDSVRGHPFLWRASLAVVASLELLWPWRVGFGWGHEGHAVANCDGSFKVIPLRYDLKSTSGQARGLPPLREAQ